MYKYEITMSVSFKKNYLVDADDEKEAIEKGHKAIDALTQNLPVEGIEKDVSYLKNHPDSGTGTAGSAFANLPCEWLPIELAPKDGTEIIIRGVVTAKNSPFGNAPYITDIYQDWWEAENNDWARWPFHEFEPTHFMPIPALSASDAK